MKKIISFVIRASMVLAILSCMGSALAEDIGEYGQKVKQQTGTIVGEIVYKRPNLIEIKKPARFMIDSETKVYNSEGMEISLEYLQFPCKAEIVFRGPEKGSYYANKISMVKQSEPGSLSQWSIPLPE